MIELKELTLIEASSAGDLSWRGRLGAGDDWSDGSGSSNTDNRGGSRNGARDGSSLCRLNEGDGGHRTLLSLDEERSSKAGKNGSRETHIG